MHEVSSGTQACVIAQVRQIDVLDKAVRALHDGNAAGQPTVVEHASLRKEMPVLYMAGNTAQGY